MPPSEILTHSRTFLCRQGRRCCPLRPRLVGEGLLAGSRQDLITPARWYKGSVGSPAHIAPVSLRSLLIYLSARCRGRVWTREHVITLLHPELAFVPLREFRI